MSERRSIAINLRLSAEEARAIDDVRSERDPMLTRVAAVRLLIAEALAARRACKPRS